MGLAGSKEGRCQCRKHQGSGVFADFKTLGSQVGRRLLQSAGRSQPITRMSSHDDLLCGCRESFRGSTPDSIHVQKRGVKLPLSLPRRWIGDLMAISEGVPRVVIDRRLNLARLAFARRSAAECPSWLVLFIKAYSVVSNKMPACGRPT